ncbi:MAG TPA: TlpA disulfide reductase family protein [Mycobacteriales bacterium]|jgi:thiol-disulfide isomerase/thioredoxin|nr:TlpA disulfide reductase family protein [Mycobacteriales bacterium]
MRPRNAAAAALLLLAACQGSDKKPGPTADPLPVVRTDACPAAGQLLPADKRPAKGTRLADVTLPCIGQDARVDMRALGGVPTVVNLWASWCLPCRTEMPDLQRSYKYYDGRVRFLGVDTERFERDGRAAIQRTAVSYPSVFDKDERIKRGLNSRNLPVTVLVGADGLIKDVHLGQLTEKELRAAVAKHLGVS